MAAQRHVAHMVRYILNDDNEDDNNIYRCAFHYMGIERPSDFLGLTMEDMQGIDVYQTDACTRMNFNIAHRRRITRLTDFWHSLPAESRSWTAVSYNEFEAYLSTQPAECGGIDYARLGREIAAAIPRPPTATEIATAVVGAVPDTATVAAAVAGALPGAPSAVDSFKKGSKRSVTDYKILQKISQWTSWRQATVATGRDHGVAKIFDPTYIPDDDAAIALFDEQQKFMFSVFATTLKESSAASLYDTYAIEGDDNYGNAQLIWRDLIQLFSEGQAGKALQRSLEREIDSLQLDRNWTKTYLAFYNATNGKMVDLRALTSCTNYPDSWCITKINHCFNTNSQMRTFISNLESSTNQVLSMATTIAAAAGGIVPTDIPDVTYEEHMSHIHEHCILIDTERALTVADKKRTQAIQKAERERVEVNNTNLSQQGRGPVRGNGGRGGDGRGRDNQVRNRGRGRGGRDNANQSSGGRGGYYVPPSVWATLDQNQRTMLLRHRDDSRQQENNHTDATSTISEVTAPTTQPAISTSNPTQSNPGSMIRQMLSNARTTASTNNHSSDGEISINGQFYAPTGRSANEAVHYTIANIGRNLGALIDGGANGGLAGVDVRVLETVPHARVDVSGITDNITESLPIVQCAALVETVDEGKVILIMSQYAKHDQGKTIHSKNQLEHFI